MPSWPEIPVVLSLQALALKILVIAIFLKPDAIEHASTKPKLIYYIQMHLVKLFVFQVKFLFFLFDKYWLR
jgi:hypothetical protein